MRAAEPYVIAVDAGGTHSRVACVATDGRLLGTAIGLGGNPSHNSNGALNISEAVSSALVDAQVAPDGCVGLVAGIAGVSRTGSNQGDGDNSWTKELFALTGITCPTTVVNDAVIAHRGALGGQPGVIVVAGTGSMILGITADGTETETGQFQHYAGGARHLVFPLIHEVLIGGEEVQDDPITTAALDHFDAIDIADLRAKVLAISAWPYNDVKRRFGSFAPRVTDLAATSPLARAALAELARLTAVGVELLARLFDSQPVPVSQAGALATSEAFTACLDEQLSIHSPSTRRAPALLDPLGGAALMALSGADGSVDPQVAESLMASFAAAPKNS